MTEYFEKCHALMNKLSKQNKQIMKLQLDFADLKEENERLKQSLERKERRIDAYEDYIKTLKEDGVLDD